MYRGSFLETWDVLVVPLQCESTSLRQSRKKSATRSRFNKGELIRKYDSVRVRLADPLLAAFGLNVISVAGDDRGPQVWQVPRIEVNPADTAIFQAIL